jgi:beta-N-acetylhexosaminidase
MLKNLITFLIIVICGVKLGLLLTSEVKANQPNSVDLIISEVNKMSLEQKIGQMLIVGFENTYLDDHIRKMIETYHIGGINLLKRNIKDSDQVKVLTKHLQKISTIPLFIATDQEGGKSVRLNFLKELTPQIKIKTKKKSEQVAFNRAKELKELGINMNFSPVLDYVSDKKSYLYGRSFGTDPRTIGSLGNAMVKGYIKGGVIPVVKHFPGYDNIYLDPHTNKAILKIDAKKFKLNLIPFQTFIKKNPFGAIMTAHIIIPSMDSKPATLSPKFLTEILREQMNFKGVIITDDIEMVSANNLCATEECNRGESSPRVLPPK